MKFPSYSYVLSLVCMLVSCSGPTLTINAPRQPTPETQDENPHNDDDGNSSGGSSSGSSSGGKSEEETKDEHDKDKKDETPTKKPPRESEIDTIGRAKQWLNRLSPEEIARIQPPLTMQALATKIQGREKTKEAPKGPEHYDETNSRVCMQRYKAQWANTKLVLGQIKRTQSCWDADKLLRIEDYAKIIEKRLANPTNNSIDEVQTIREPYLRIQNLLSYCRTESYLGGKVAPLLVFSEDSQADKILLHMVGDVFGKDSGLEGLSGVSHLEKRQDFLERLQSTLAQTFIKDENQADPCHSLTDIPTQNEISVTPYPDPTQKIADLVTRGKILVDLTRKLQNPNAFIAFETAFNQAVNDLKNPDDHFYIQGGWLMHAVIYEVRKTKNNSFSFRVFNSGEGLNYHLSITATEREQFFPYLEKSDVSQKSLLSKGFLKTLYDLKKSQASGNQADDKNLYSLMSLALDGTIMTRSPNFEDFVDPQISGTCAYYSIPYYHKAINKDPVTTDFVETHIQFGFMNEYFQENEGRLGAYSVPYNLAKKALVFFSESIGTAQLKGQRHVDSGLEQIISEKITIYHAILSKAFEAMMARLEQNYKDAANQLQNARNAAYKKPGFALPKEINPTTTRSTSKVSSRENWVPNAAYLKQDFGQTISEIGLEIENPIYDDTRREAILQTLQSIGLKLPLAEDFLLSLNSDDLKEILNQTRKLSEFFIFSIFMTIANSPREERGITPVEYLAQLKFFSFGERILRELKKKDANSYLAKIPNFSLFFPQITPYLNGEHLLLTTYDARWQADFNEISKFWKETPVQEFFDILECRNYFETKGDHKIHRESLQEKCAHEYYPDDQSKEVDWLQSQLRTFKPVSRMLSVFDVIYTQRAMIRKWGWSGSQYETMNRNLWGFSYDPSFSPALQSTERDFEKVVFDFKYYAEDPYINGNYKSQHVGWNAGTPLVLSLKYLEETPLSVQSIGQGFFDLRALSSITRFFNKGVFSKNYAQQVSRSWNFFRNKRAAYLQKVKNKFDLSDPEVQNTLDPTEALSIPFSPFEDKCTLHDQVGWICETEVFGFAQKDIGSFEALDFWLAKNENVLTTLSEPVGKYSRVRQTTNNLVISNFSEAQPKQTFDTLRQVATIAQSQRSQIHQAFGYFLENQNLLLQAEWRDLLKKLHFDPGILEKEAQKNPLLSKDLGEFCRVQYQFYKDSKDIVQASYFLRLNQYYSEQLQLLQQKHPGLVRYNVKDFLDTKAELIKAIDENREDETVSVLLFRDLIRAYSLNSKFANAKDLAWFLIAHIYRDVHTERKIYEIDLENDIRGMLVRKKDIIEQYLKKDTTALNETLQFFHSSFDPKGFTWVANYPLYELSKPGNTFNASIDVGRGELLITGRKQKTLHPDIVNDSYYQKLIGTSSFESLPLDLEPFTEFVIKQDKQRIRYRIAVDQGSVIVRRKWGSRWYEHMRDQDIIERTLKKEDDNRDQTELGLFPGFSHWLAVDETEDRFGYTDLTSDEAYTDQNVFQSDTSNFEILIFSDVQSHLAMVTFLTNKPPPRSFYWNPTKLLEVSKTVKASSDGKTLSDLVLHPLDPNSPYFGLLGKFEHPRYIFIWMKPSAIDAQIEMPRLNLQFTFNSLKNKILSNEYGILEPTVVPSLIHTQNYLVFSGTNGVSVLSSHFKIEREGKSLDSSANRPAFEIEKYEHAKRKFFVYGLDTNSKELKAFDSSAKFYLSYLYLLQQNPESYQRTLALLQKLKAQMGPFSEYDLQTTEWFLSNNLTINDPFFIALRFKALALATENSANFPSGSLKKTYMEDQARELADRKFINVIGLYSLYLKQRSRILESWLPPDEEIWLFFKDTFSEMSELFTVRFNQITENTLKGSVGTSNLGGLSLEERDIDPHWILILNYNSISFSRSRINTPTESVLQGGSLQRYFPEFYDIASNLHFLSQTTLENKIRALFISMGLGEARFPLEDFKSYLLAIELSGNTNKENEIDLARLLRAIIENPGTVLPSWYEIESVYKKRDQANRLSASVQETFNRELNALTAQFPTKLRRKSIEPLHMDSTFSKSSLESKVPKIYERPTNPHSEAAVHFDKVPLEPGIDKYLLDAKSPIQNETQIAALLRETPLTGPSKDVLKTKIKDLKEAFKLNPSIAHTQGPGANKTKINAKTLQSVEQLHSRLDTYRNRLLTVPNYSIPDISKFKDLKDSLTLRKQNEIDPLHQQLKATILDLANKTPEEWFSKARRIIEKTAQLRQDSDLDALNRMFATKNRGSFFKSNEVLTANDIQKLLTLIKSYLVVSTYRNKVDEVIQLSSKIYDNHSKWKFTPEIEQSELQNFKTSASQIRSFKVDEFPEYLVFEYYMGFLIREEQKTALDALDIKSAVKNDPDAKGALYELIMGSGKTSVLLPLISFQNMDKDSLSVVVFPEALLPSMSQQINEQMQTVFGLKVEVIDVKRSFHKAKKIETTGKSEAEIKEELVAENNERLRGIQSVLDRLTEALQSKKLVIMSNSSIQSLFLLFVDAMRDESKREQIHIFRNIFTFLKKHAYVTIDEVDSVLDIMKAHRFSIGKPTTFNKDAFFPSIGLFHLIVQDPDIRSHLDLAFLEKDAGNKAPAFSIHHYNSIIKPMLVAKLASKKSVRSLFFHDLTPEVEALYGQLDPVELAKFLGSEDPDFNQLYLNKTEDEVLRGFLATLYTQIHLTLPLTWEKLYKVHYGLYPLTPDCDKRWCPEFISIPYHSGTPLPESRFGSDLESLNYAIQSHLEERNCLRALQFVLDKLKNEYAKATKKRKAIVMDRARLFFPNLTESRLMSMSTKEVQPFAAAINKDQGLLLNLLVQPLRAHISVFNKQTSTNALIYPSLFNKIQGVTGTLWNVETMAPFYDKDKVRLSDTTEKTLTLLWTKSRHDISILGLAGAETLDGKVDSLFKARQAGSVIDQGGLFRGYNNLDVARKILMHSSFSSPRIYENIIFYDQEHNIKVFSIDGSIKNYHPSLVNRSKTVAFWDIQHTTGSDLKVSETDVAVMIVNKNTILRDLMQSAWRLRGLHLAQSVNFAIQEPDLDYIKSYLSLYFSKNIKDFALADLLFYTFMREADLLNEQTHRSITLGMKDELIKPILSYALQTPLTDTGYKGFYGLTSSLFEVNYPDYSYTVYGHPVVETPTPIALSGEKRAILGGKILQYTKDNILDERALEAALSSVEARGIRFLPPIIRTQRREFESQIEVETELEMELELETNIEQEIEQKIEMHAVDANLLPRDFWPWKEDDFFKGSAHSNLLSEQVLLNTEIDEASTKLSPLTSLATAMKVKGLKSLAPYFHSKILISMNAAPVYIPKKDAHKKPFQFFSALQKEFNDVLVVSDKTGAVQSISLISREETEILGDWLNEDLQAASSKIAHSQGMLLYNLGGNFYRYNKNVQKFIDNEPKYLDIVKASNEFVELIMQIKYFTGRSNLSAQEMKALEHWLDKAQQGQKELLTAFEGQVLKIRQKGKADFNSSEMASLFSQRKKLLDNSKYSDQTSEFEFGSDDQRKDAKESLIRRIKSGDKAAWEESQKLIDKVLEFSSDEGVLEDAIDISMQLVALGHGIEKAALAVIRQILENRSSVKEKWTQLGRRVFAMKEGRDAIFTYFNKEIYTEGTPLGQVVGTLNLLFERFSDELCDNTEFVDTFLQGPFKQALAAKIDVASILKALIEHKTTSLPRLSMYFARMRVDPDANIRELALPLAEQVSKQVARLNATNIGDLINFAKEVALQKEEADAKVAFEILLTLIKGKSALAVKETQDLLSSLKGSPRHADFLRDLTQTLKDLVTDEKPGNPLPADLLVAIFHFESKIARDEKNWNTAISMIVLHLGDTRSELRTNAVDLGKELFKEPDARMAYANSIKSVTQWEKDLESALFLVKTFKDAFLTDSAFLTEFYGGFFADVLDKMPRNTSATDPATKSLLEFLDLLLSSSESRAELSTQLIDWQVSKTQKRRALTLHRLLLNRPGPSLIDEREIIHFAQETVRDPDLAVDALRILAYFVKRANHDAIDYAIAAVVFYYDETDAGISNERDVLATLLRQDPDTQKILEAAIAKRSTVETADHGASPGSEPPPF